MSVKAAMPNRNTKFTVSTAISEWFLQLEHIFGNYLFILRPKLPTGPQWVHAISRCTICFPSRGLLSRIFPFFLSIHRKANPTRFRRAGSRRPKRSKRRQGASARLQFPFMVILQTLVRANSATFPNPDFILPIEPWLEIISLLGNGPCFKRSRTREKVGRAQSRGKQCKSNRILLP